MKTIEGDMLAEGKRFVLVAARFNDAFAEKLLDGAIDALVRHGSDREDLAVVRCPGSFELPQVAARLAESGDYDAIVCLGVLIRGATPHFDHIASQTASGIGRVGVDSGVPTTFGVLTCDTVDQAIERSGSKAGNKGAEAALAAIEMANLYDNLEGSR